MSIRIKDLQDAENKTIAADDYIVVDNPTLGTRKIPSGRSSNGAVGNYSHAEGYNTTASGYYSHAEGYNTTASNESSHAEGNYTTASGHYSHAEGSNATASGRYSHAEGFRTTALNESSHAEGYNTTASGYYSHAEGYYTTASGNYSHAEGANAKALGYHSHAGGNFCEALAESSIAMGNNLIARAAFSASFGTCNVGSMSNDVINLFEIGNGGDPNNRSNAFSVGFDGKTRAANTITASTTADYAEFFEWADQNPDNEDRVGHFVTFDENNSDKIRVATPEDDYILGIVSGAPFVLGNGDCDVWNGMYLRDDFGRYLTEPAPKMEIIELTDKEGKIIDTKMIEVTDENGNPVYEGIRLVVNPEYDSSRPYVSRFNRSEWAPVGMLGVLAVYDDGDCQVNGYCKCGEGGIAVPAIDTDQNKYRVIKRVTDNIVKVVFR